MSDPIKRFYVRDGFVLDEHPTGQVVRYGHHMARIEKLEEERDEAARGNTIFQCEYATLEADIEEYKQMHYHDRQKIKRLEAERDRLRELVRDGGFLLTAYCNQVDVPYGVARLADRFRAALEEGGNDE